MIYANNEMINGLTEITPETDPVKHPNYYNAGGIEVWDIIEAYGLDFPLGSSVKYILRAGKKDPAKKVEDLKKAIENIEREILETTRSKE